MRTSLALVPCLMFALSLLHGCGTDNPTQPDARNRDTTPPTVVRTVPSNFQVGIDVDDPVFVVFDEAMDPQSAVGAVSVSTGDSISLTWVDDRKLRIDHDWFQDLWVTVRVDDQLTDKSGNPLATPLEFSFGTESPHFVFLGSSPGDGAVDVDRGAKILLHFNEPPDLDSLDSRVQVSVVDQNYSLSTKPERGLARGQVAMILEDPLPANAEIEVTIPSSLVSEYGRSLAWERSFTFETGPDLDTQHPALVRVEPNFEDVLDRATTSLRLVFSEAMDVATFEPRHVSTQLAILLAAEGLKAYWTGDRRTWVLPLPKDMPTGLPILLAFDSFSDAGGNTNEAGLSIRAEIAGKAELFPGAVVNTFGVTVREKRRTASSTTNVQETRRFGFERVDADVFRHLRYSDGSEEVLDHMEYKRVNDSILIAAFTEHVPGAEPALTTLEPGLPVLWNPLTYGSRTGSSNFTREGLEFTISYRLTFLGIEDLDAGQYLYVRTTDDYLHLPEETLWADCRKLRMEYTIRQGELLMSESTQTSWYAPAIGLVLRETSNRDLSSDVQIETRENVFDFDLRP